MEKLLKVVFSCILAAVAFAGGALVGYIAAGSPAGAVAIGAISTGVYFLASWDLN